MDQNRSQGGLTTGVSLSLDLNSLRFHKRRAAEVTQSRDEGSLTEGARIVQSSRPHHIMYH